MFKTIIEKWKRWFDAIVDESSEESFSQKVETSSNTTAEDEQPVEETNEMPSDYAINLLIADNVITVRTTTQAEASLRITSLQVNQMVEQYKEHYPESTNEQLLTFVAIKLAMDNTKNKNEGKNDEA